MKGISKQLILISDKPMLYYSLSILVGDNQLLESKYLRKNCEGNMVK